MDRVGGFDPGVGIYPLGDGREEIGRANLPLTTRVIPESGVSGFEAALLYGKLTDSSLMERFAASLAPGLDHRELLAPDVFFATLDELAEAWNRRNGGAEGEPGEGPLVAAARALNEILSDKALCDMLRTMVLRA